MNKRNSIVSILIFALAVPSAYAFRADRARSLQEVRTIWVDADVCPMGIGKELEQHGFEVATTRRHADTVLEVDVLTNGRYAKPNSIEQARYSASLIGDDGDVLFRTSGEESDHDLDNLCEEVGEDIADKLENVIKS